MVTFPTIRNFELLSPGPHLDLSVVNLLGCQLDCWDQPCDAHVPEGQEGGGSEQLIRPPRVNVGELIRQGWVNSGGQLAAPRSIVNSNNQLAGYTRFILTND